MKPILKDFPEEFTTERLVIRMPNSGDENVVYEAMKASIHELKSWLQFAQKVPSEPEVELNIMESQISLFMN